MRISPRILALAAAALAGYGAGRWHGGIADPARAVDTVGHADATPGQATPEIRALVEKAAEQALPLPTLPALPQASPEP